MFKFNSWFIEILFIVCFYVLTFSILFGIVKVYDTPFKYNEILLILEAVIAIVCPVLIHMQFDKYRKH
ncbi:hypothetical protein [Mycoplasma sp. P36-A1]|uniref:hypothetical protein n=1 Tax=Mycoplasma sp. P36-A1 TaxID=3252900 RepID=UPI003C2FF24F